MSGFQLALALLPDIDSSILPQLLVMTIKEPVKQLGSLSSDEFF